MNTGLMAFLAAIAGGVLGGLLVLHIERERVFVAGHDIVRASSFELVDTSRRLRTTWKCNGQNQCSITFLGAEGTRCLEVGVLSGDGTPFVHFLDRAGQSRLTMATDYAMRADYHDGRRGQTAYCTGVHRRGRALSTGG